MIFPLLPGTNLCSKANVYFETYMSSNGPPPGDGTYPTHLNYFGYELLSDNNVRFMSSFIPQFCYFLSLGFQENEYYRNKMLPDWLNADYQYWSLALNENSEIWGNPVHGKVWGAGAGPGPSGYSVERIDGSSDLVISGKGLSLNILTKLYFLLPIYLPTIG